MTLRSLLKAELVFPGIQAEGRNAALREIAQNLSAAGSVSDAETLFSKLRDREDLDSTGLGRGVAIPHCKLRELSQPVVALATCQEGVDFNATDGQPVRVFFVVVSPAKGAGVHLNALAQISRWLKDGGNVDALLGLEEPEAMLAVLDSSNGAAGP